MKINSLNDSENIKQQRNMTNSQKRINTNIKEGVIVNSFIKDNLELGLSDVYNNLIISNEVNLPHKLNEDKETKNKGMLAITGISTGVMAIIALFSLFVKKNTKIITNLAKEKWLPTVTRNVQLSEETTQAIYQMIQNPSRESIIAGTGVLGLTSMAFMGKTFMDGYKDILVKRKEANIQKNLQEQLISVETESFSGKMQIVRSMLSKYAKQFEEYINPSAERKVQNFGQKRYNQIAFTSEQKINKNENRKNIFANIILGVGALGTIIGLGLLTFKNASKSRQFLKRYLDDTKNVIKNIAESTTGESKQSDMKNLENLFKIVNATPEYISEIVNKTNWCKEDKTTFITKIIKELKTSTTKVNQNIGGDGTPKPAFNSFVDDYRAFFYNWLLDPSNQQFKQLFLGVTGVTAISYLGKIVGDGMKEVEVKKFNAKTELELQKKLVSTELRNFKSKKDSVITPLVDEFYKQVQLGKSKQELKVMAENILFEIKNGAPFVYS